MTAAWSSARPVVAVARERLSADLGRQGRPFAAFAATVLACRGLLVLDPAAFARLLGVGVDHVRRLESGWRPPDHAPRRLATLAPELGWPGVGLDPDDGADRARRHPANLRARLRRDENDPP